MAELLKVIEVLAESEKAGRTLLPGLSNGLRRR